MIKHLFSAIQHNSFSLKFFLEGVGLEGGGRLLTKNITYLTTDFDIKISFFYDRWLKLTAESKDGSEMKTCDLSAMRTIFNTNRI